MTEHYDAIVMGAGWGGLAAATLLAKSGRRVAVLEARDRAGGCGQSFTRQRSGVERSGEQGFSFCAEMQYLMGCGAGGTVNRWLRDLSLDEVVTFNALEPSGYDRIDLPGSSFRIPLDPHRFEASLIETFPEDREGITKLFAIMGRMEQELTVHGIDLAYLERHPFEFETTVLHGMWPAVRIFEHLALSPRLRAVLAGQCGDVGLGPNEEPFGYLQALIFGYGTSVRFPKRGMGFFVDEVVRYLTTHEGMISYETPVTRIVRDGAKITSIETSRGTFTADLFISNIDPARTFSMIEGGPSPSYEQSVSCFTVFLGLDVDLATQGFGRFNVWSYPDEDIDASLDRSRVRHEYDDPFFFLSTPSLYTDRGVLARPGMTTVQINVPGDFDWFTAAAREGRHDAERARIAEEIVSAVERRLVPGLKKHRVLAT